MMVILLTHLHDDHMGGLVRDGKIVFPNAVVHVGKPDLDFFLDQSNWAKAHYDMKYFDEAFKTIKVYVDAGKVQSFSSSSLWCRYSGWTRTTEIGSAPLSHFWPFFRLPSPMF
jgi:metal-dependent hydrolase (beta-lactamase superfamily II)